MASDISPLKSFMENLWPIYGNLCSQEKRIGESLQSFRPIPKASKKNAAMSDQKKTRSNSKKGKRKQSVARARKSILPIPMPCKQIIGFTYQSATKFLYRISSRFVQYLAQRASQYPQNPQKVLEEQAQMYFERPSVDLWSLFVSLINQVFHLQPSRCASYTIQARAIARACVLFPLL